MYDNSEYIGYFLDMKTDEKDKCLEARGVYIGMTKIIGYYPPKKPLSLRGKTGASEHSEDEGGRSLTSDR